MRAISVVVPAFNAAATIRSALESALAQETPGRELEIVVVDDGSTDETAALVEAVAAGSGGMIRLLRQANAGPSAARNRGAAAARGGYLAFLDADDSWLPGKLDAQARVLDADPEAALVCTPRNGRRFRPDLPSFRIPFRSLLFSNRVYTSSVLIRKEAFEEAGGFDPGRRLSEDYELWLKVARRGAIVALNEPFLRYAEDSGLSSRLWPMERGELETLGIIKSLGYVSPPRHLAALCWSLLKYVRRRMKRVLS